MLIMTEQGWRVVAAPAPAFAPTWVDTRTGDIMLCVMRPNTDCEKVIAEAA